MKRKLTVAALVLCAIGVAIVLLITSDPDRHSRSDETRRPPAGGGGVPDGGDSTDPRADASEGTTGEAADRNVGEAGSRGGMGKLTRRKGIGGGGKEKSPPPVGTGIVTGRVRLVDGSGPGGVRIGLRGYSRNEERKWVSHEHETLTDEAGEFAFEALPMGGYALEATHDGYATHKFRFHLVEGQVKDPIEIVLTRGGALRIRVVDGRGEPRPGLEILIKDDSPVHAIVRQGKTGHDGVYLAEHLGPGQYWIERRLGGPEKEATRTVTVMPDKTVEVVFRDECGLTGTVLGPDGKPLAGAAVSLTPVDFKGEGYRSYGTTSDDNGKFELSGFPAGEYEIGVQVFGKNPYATRVGVLTLAPGTKPDHVIRVEPTEVSGKITIAATGKPLGNPPGGNRVQISAYRAELAADGTPSDTWEYAAMAFAKEDGTYRFIGLPPGTYRIWVYPFVSSLREARRFVEVTPGSRLTEVDFALEDKRLGRLRLTVLEPDGTPAKGISFGLVRTEKDKDGKDLSVSTTLFGREVGDGVYLFYIEIGERTVSVYRKGFIAEDLEVTIDPKKTAERTVKLRPAEE